jgi:hypothetical protein
VAFIKYLFIILLIIFSSHRFLLVYWHSKKKNPVAHRFQNSETMSNHQAINLGKLSDSDKKIIAKIKTPEMAAALGKIGSFSNSGPTKGTTEPPDFGHLGQSIESIEDTSKFRNWVDQNLKEITSHPKKVFDDLDSYYSGSPLTEDKIEKLNYLLTKFADNAENLDSENSLYFKIAKDNSPEGSPLAMTAFLKLAFHKGLNEDDRYRESVEFIKQRTNPDEINTFVTFFLSKNPQFESRIKSEFIDSGGLNESK